MVKAGQGIDRRLSPSCDILNASSPGNYPEGFPDSSGLAPVIIIFVNYAYFLQNCHNYSKKRLIANHMQKHCSVEFFRIQGI